MTALSRLRAPRFMITGLMAAALIVFTTAAHARGAPDSFADLAAKLLPSVVNISTTQKIQAQPGLPDIPNFPEGSPFNEFFRDFFDRQQRSPQAPSRRATSLGSGFFIAKDMVITNNHVIEGADEISVVLQDNTRLKAEIIGRDPKTDVAVLKVKHSKELTIAPLEFGDSDKVRVGDWVLAIGNPFGLGGTVTAGIVSARGRDINAGPYDDFLQTDASINKGNSGGPMFDMDGRVIGINTAIYSPSGGSVGIGFAVPISIAEPVIEQLIKYGRTKRGWLGVRIEHVTEEIAESIGMDKAMGALVGAVTPDSPADKAGILPGDVILTFDGQEVTDMRKLPRIVAETEINSNVKTEVWRNNQQLTFNVNVGEMVETEAAGLSPTHDGDGPGAQPGVVKVAAIGLSVIRPSVAVREKFSLGDGDIKGVVVAHVDEEGPAAVKGIRAGDVIVGINQQQVESPKDFVGKIEDAQGKKRKSVLLRLERRGDLRHLVITFKLD